MVNTSVMNLPHFQTNWSCIIDFSKHRMPHLFLESNLIEIDRMSQQTVFSNVTFTSRNTPSQFV